MGTHPQQYIHNVASSVLGQVGISFGTFSDLAFSQTDSPKFANDIYKEYGCKIMAILGRMGPAARGRIAACGVGKTGLIPFGVSSHWDVNQGAILNEGYSGNELLTLLATYVVIAAIVDILRANIREEREREGVPTMGL